MELALLLLFAIGALGAIVQYYSRKRADEQRLDQLQQKYADSPYKDDVLNGLIRQGMTAEEVVDSWGPPAAVDERVLKTKVVHTYKYGQTGRNSFRQRVTIENGFVVGWTQR